METFAAFFTLYCATVTALILVLTYLRSQRDPELERLDMDDEFKTLQLSRRAK